MTHAFTVATYHKKRAEGVPVVFCLTREGTIFWKVNSNGMSMKIVSPAKETVHSFRTTRDGGFRVSIASLASAERLRGPRTRLLGKCVDTDLSMEDSRDAMKHHQILTLFIRRMDSNLGGDRNHNSQENHHKNHQENAHVYSQEHNQGDLSHATRHRRQSFKQPTDNTKKIRHVSPSDLACSIQK
ncbi:hypothetical protein HPB50_028221 [Hyalomma asiaticum]|nr:hypothetical protein HPB50_028221 [Hyalomma asiaticum]